MEEMVIRHDGKNWVVENGEIRFAAPTLDDLDQGLGRIMKQRGLLKKGETKEVFMAFDSSSIPQWIRQYACHYFNRIVKVEG